MRIIEDTFKRFRRNEINFVKCLKELLHIAWYDNNKTLNTNDEKNFEISFRNKNEFDYALDRMLSNLKRIGAKRIKNNRALGRITFLMPDTTKENIINMFTAKEDEREKAYKDSIESADISKYYPSDEVLNKIRGYRDRGSKINVRAMNNIDKILTYYYACILLDWEKSAVELSDKAMEIAIHKEDVKNILNAIYEKTEAQETDERDALAKKENLPKNDLIQFSDKIRRQKGTWLPKSILKFFIDNNIPVRLDGRSYGGDYDRNGVQWSERENFTVYPDTDHEIKDSIVVNTLESGGPTKYTYGRAGVRVGVQKVLDALANKYLRRNESMKIISKRKMNESLNESDNGEKLGRWLGARLLTGWTAMLNVDGAEESPYYDEYDQLFNGTFVQCLNKLKEYQDIIDRDGVPAYLALQSSHDEYFDGDYDTIIDKLYDRGYLYDNDLEESFNVSDETIEDAIEYYRENAFGFDGLKDYVETDFSHLPKETRNEIYNKMKKKLDESLNESCNSYQYKGKTIINAGDYWFVKGYEEKFPTSDEAEEFVDDMKKDEGLEDKFRGPKPLRSFDDVLKAEKNREKLYYYEDGVGNDDNPIPVVVAGRPNKFQIPLARLGVDEPYTFTIMDFRNLSRDKAGNLDKLANESMKINIRESLNKMDAESDNTYDLLNLYESKNLSRKQKKDIARMIYENYGLERIYNYLYEATEESEDELPVEDRVKELTNDFKNTNGSYVFEDGQDANKAISILKSRGYEASQKRTQDGKYRVTAEKKNNNK